MLAARGRTPDESSGRQPGLLAAVREVMRRPLPFRGWRHTLTVWAAVFAAVTVTAIVRAKSGRDPFYSYVSIAVMLFACSIFMLDRLIETTKRKALGPAGEPKKSVDTSERNADPTAGVSSSGPDAR
jgi:hypothetical protein